MAALAKRRTPMSVDEFLAWEGEAGVKYELADGMPRAMAPASPTHGVIQSTMARIVGNHLVAHREDCSIVIAPGIVPRIQSATNFRIPDLAVSCSPIEAHQKALAEPILIVEIFSPSNLRETRENIWTFTTIPSVREILALHSTKIAAELLRRRPDGTWPELPEEIGRDGVVRLDSIGFDVRITEFYGQTHFGR